MDKKQLYLLVIILAAALIIRLYNFQDRILFGPEQAISLIVSGDYIKDKFSLLGQPNIQRTTGSGLMLYSPAMFNYSLVPLLLLFSYDPVKITYYFAFLNLLTGLILFIYIKRIFKFGIAIFSTILFLFNSTMIYHSTFIWTHNYIPLLNIFIFYFLYKYWKNNSNKYIPFCLGILTSLCLSPEYFYIFTLGSIFILTVYLSKNKLITTLLFLIGAIIGSLPTIIFDLKHNFYHLITLWEYTIDTFSTPSQSKIVYYHFLQFWPLMALLGGLAIHSIWIKKKFLALIILCLYLFINFRDVSFYQAIGAADRMTISKIDEGAAEIAKDNPQNFNVSSTIKFDSPRAYPLRYFLKFKYGLTPKGIEEYLNISSLYILANKDYDFSKASLWEIYGPKLTKVIDLKDIDETYTIFKLTD